LLEIANRSYFRLFRGRDQKGEMAAAMRSFAAGANAPSLSFIGSK
jgi:hypothetical protein